MTDALNVLILGLVSASIYAVAASGLVVTYTTSGIFNFAHGAIAMFSAFVYWQLRRRMLGLPAPVALVLTVFVFAPLLGVVIDRVIMRRLHDASTITKIVVSIGLLVASDPARHRDLAARHGAGEPAAVLPGPQGQDRPDPDSVPRPRGLRGSDRRRGRPSAPSVPDQDRRGHARGRRQPGARRAQRGEPRPGVSAQLGARLDACRGGRCADRSHPRPRSGATHPARARRLRRGARRPAAQPAAHGGGGDHPRHIPRVRRQQVRRDWPTWITNWLNVDTVPAIMLFIVLLVVRQDRESMLGATQSRNRIPIPASAKPASPPSCSSRWRGSSRRLCMATRSRAWAMAWLWPS